MKKIITVLMVLMVATSMFAETKVSDLFPSDGETKELFKNEIEERVAYTDTSYKEMDYEKITTDEIISIIDEPSKEMKLDKFATTHISVIKFLIVMLTHISFAIFFICYFVNIIHSLSNDT